MTLRTSLLALAFVLAGCATPGDGPAAEPASPPPTRSVWDGYGSVETQAAIRACLDRERAEGDMNTCTSVRAPPSASPGPRERLGFFNMRQASWVTIDDWEAVMDQSLAWLREHGPTEDINASQEKWMAAMIADVGLYMDMFEGGSMSGQMAEIGAGIRSSRTVERVLFLEEYRKLLEINE